MINDYFHKLGEGKSIYKNQMITELLEKIKTKEMKDRRTSEENRIVPEER